jgi:hypothetical protein
MNELIWYS